MNFAFSERFAEVERIDPYFGDDGFVWTVQPAVEAPAVTPPTDDPAVPQDDGAAFAPTDGDDGDLSGLAVTGGGDDDPSGLAQTDDGMGPADPLDLQQDDGLTEPDNTPVDDGP